MHAAAISKVFGKDVHLGLMQLSCIDINSSLAHRLPINETIDVSSRNAEFINRSVNWIATEFNTGRDFRIADFGCGPGLYSARLAKRGANVTGIDFTGNSIEYAKAIATREQLNIIDVNQNYLLYW